MRFYPALRIFGGLVLLFGASFLLLGSMPASAGPPPHYTVDRTDDFVNADDCLDAVPDDCSLRGAVRAANGDGVASVIVLPHGRYDLTIEGGGEDASLTGDLDVRFDGLTIQAAPDALPEIRQLTGDRIFHVDPQVSEFVIEGPLTLTGGEAFAASGDERGGSIYFFQADSLSLTDVDFVGGFATDWGGCLYAAASSVSGVSVALTDVSFEDCGTEGNGGGFFLQPSGATASLDGVVARGNSAGESGGGGYVIGGSTTVVIQRSAFEENTAAAGFTTSTFGGGLYLSGGFHAIHESLFTDNTVGDPQDNDSSGGGLFAQNASILLRNSTLSGNHSLAGVLPQGSEIEVHNSQVGLDFVTVHQGTGPEAIYALTGSSIEPFASIVEGLCGGGGTYDSEGFNVEYPPGGTGPTGCLFDHAGDETTTEAILGPLANYGGPTRTHSVATPGVTLRVSSASCPDTDQRGALRLGLFCHSGAHEAGVEAPGSEIFADGFESGDATAWQ